MSDNKQMEVIDLKKIFLKLWQRKMLFIKVLPVVFILACFYILCIPRYYQSNTKMAPELESSMGGGTLGSLASSLGINLGEMQTSDAITPLLYPDLMEDNKFVTDMFHIKVETQDGEIKTDYYTYLKKHQKHPWWTKMMAPLWGLFASKEKGGGKQQEFNPYTLSKKDDDIAGGVRNNISLNIDKRTGVITITTTAQDPLVCKTLADSVRTMLQSYITEYRTSKARKDLDYYEHLTKQAKEDYEKARRLYGSYADANTDVILESYRAKQTDLENDMQLKYNNYSTMLTQLQAAKAKVQERTPAFTMIKGASVPIKPSGPKRMIFVLTMLILATIVTCGYILIKDFSRS